MGQMQRRKRKLREAMRREGENVPSHKTAIIRAWSVHLKQSLIVSRSGMDALKARREIRAVQPRPDGSHKIEIARIVTAALDAVIDRAKEAFDVRP